MKEPDNLYHSDEKFTVQEAIDSFTIRGAEASFEENQKGHIKTGMLADFVVLDDNPFTISSHKINEISISATYLGGKKVYGN